MLVMVVPCGRSRTATVLAPPRPTEPHSADRSWGLPSARRGWRGVVTWRGSARWRSPMSPPARPAGHGHAVAEQRLYCTPGWTPGRSGRARGLDRVVRGVPLPWLDQRDVLGLTPAAARRRVTAFGCPLGSVPRCERVWVAAPLGRWPAAGRPRGEDHGDGGLAEEESAAALLDGRSPWVRRRRRATPACGGTRHYLGDQQNSAGHDHFGGDAAASQDWPLQGGVARLAGGVEHEIGPFQPCSWARARRQRCAACGEHARPGWRREVLVAGDRMSPMPVQNPRRPAPPAPTAGPARRPHAPANLADCS